MMGWFAEIAGATLTGTLFIYLIGRWRAKNSDSFGSPTSKALSGTVVGWLVVSAIRVWGVAPVGPEMLMSPIILLPSFLIAFFLVRMHMIKIDREESNSEVFE